MKKPAKRNSKPEVSIIILSYNTLKLLKNCLHSLERLVSEVMFETIVADNGSWDGSVEMVARYFPWVKVIQNDSNLGFAKGNNAARFVARGKHVLFLNSDTIVHPGTLKKTLSHLKKNKKIGALTCKLIMADGSLDKDARRSFPTPWVALTHLVLKIDRIFPRSRLFAKYWYGYIHEDEYHEVDVIQGAFFLSPRKVLDEVDWFSEEYFLDGEDVDICWKIRQKGYKIVYFPEASILHLKGVSKGKSGAKKNVPLKSRLKFKMASVNSMEIFYKKWLWCKYPLAVNLLVLSGIKFLKVVRFVKTAIA